MKRARSQTPLRFELAALLGRFENGAGRRVGKRGWAVETDVLTIRRIGADDVEAFRRIRLEALREEPSAYASSYEDSVVLTDEDWRNREKWEHYTLASADMIQHTSTPHAPWTVVEANNKLFARIKVLKTFIEAMQAALNDNRPKPPLLQ